eukprot:2106434-Karenia_brevis.AAC.1
MMDADGESWKGDAEVVRSLVARLLAEVDHEQTSIRAMRQLVADQLGVPLDALDQWQDLVNEIIHEE